MPVIVVGKVSSLNEAAREMFRRELVASHFSSAILLLVGVAGSGSSERGALSESQLHCTS